MFKKENNKKSCCIFPSDQQLPQLLLSSCSSKNEYIYIHIHIYIIYCPISCLLTASRFMCVLLHKPFGFFLFIVSWRIEMCLHVRVLVELRVPGQVCVNIDLFYLFSVITQVSNNKVLMISYSTWAECCVFNPPGLFFNYYQTHTRVKLLYFHRFNFYIFSPLTWSRSDNGFFFPLSFFFFYQNLETRARLRPRRCVDPRSFYYSARACL